MCEFSFALAFTLSITVAFTLSVAVTSSAWLRRWFSACCRGFSAVCGFRDLHPHWTFLVNRGHLEELVVLLAVACGAAVAGLLGAHHHLLGAAGAAGLLAAARGPLVLAGGLGLVVAVAALAARLVACRRGLARRARLVVLAPDSFDPSLDAVLRFAGQLSRVRRTVGGWLDRPASAVRFLLDTDQDGMARYSLVVPERALPAVRAALANYDRVQARRFKPPARADLLDEDGRERRRVHVVRAELRLARGSSEPLAQPTLEPDPLQPLMACLVEHQQGEQAQVIVDLLPCGAGARRRLRRQLLRGADPGIPGDPPPRRAEPPFDLLLAGRGSARQSATALVERRAHREQLARKLLQPEPLFQVQLLLRCQAPTRELALHRMQALLGCFDAMAHANSYRVAGVRLLGFGFLGSDLPGVRGFFDRRADSERFAPARRGFVSAREMAWLLKPPTVHCRTPGVLRLGAAVNPPPRSLPTLAPEKASELLPLGRVEGPDGERLVGVRLADTFFTYITGRSRWGKTELAICQFLHLVRAGHGGLFLDPHEDAIKRIKSCLTEEQYARRILELDVVGVRSHEAQPGWNLFAAKDLSPQAAEARVQAIVDSFASALQWGERNNRALTLTTQAAAALIELSRRLPVDCQPTIFQIPTLLGNPDWLAAVMPYLSVPRRQFFGERFPRLAEEAITPVTNLIDRLRSSTQLACLLGAQSSSYDIYAAMQERRIVLACPGAGGATDRLVANLLVFDLLHSAKRRAHLPVAQRAAFHVFLDEVQTYDGAASGNLAALLEQTAKYGIRATLLNQNPERLTRDTLQALTTNRSHLIATALNAQAAGLIAREWAGDPNAAAITSLPRYTFLAQATVHGELTSPFLFHGLPVEQQLPGKQHPELLDQAQRQIDQASGRKPAAETLAELDTLDQRILDALKNAPKQHGTSAPAGRSELPEIAGPEGS